MSGGGEGLDRVFTGLADPGRRAMIDRLAAGPASASELAAPTTLALPSVMKHLAVLEASGARWEDLVDVTVYLTDMARDFAAYNAVWAEHFPDAATAPCRTTLGITALPTPIAIELKCVAHLED